MRMDVATLSVRNLEEDLVRRPRIRAAEHGRSAEAEHREIPRAALTPAADMEARKRIAARPEEFRHRTTVPEHPVSTVELLRATRQERTRQPLGDHEDD